MSNLEKGYKRKSPRTFQDLGDFYQHDSRELKTPGIILGSSSSQKLFLDRAGEIPPKGLKAKKIASLTSTEAWQGWGGAVGTRQLNELSRNYKRLLKVENLACVKPIMYRP